VGEQTAPAVAHCPVWGSHRLPDGQLTGIAPVQTPAWQLSPLVQALPSLQPTPSAAFGLEQAPVAASHVPATWHWSSAVQTTGVPVQTPLRQASPAVHLSPSSQAVSSGKGEKPVALTAGSQCSHGLPGLGSFVL
jgi:hypothetical protein